MSGSDSTLIARAVSGDHDALSALLVRFGEEAARQVARGIGPAWQSLIGAEDVMQVTYMEAFLRIHTLASTDERSFVSWLRRMAENNLRDAIRGLEAEKRPSPKQRLTPYAGAESVGSLLELMASSTTTPSRKAGRAELAQVMESALQKLPEDYGRVLRFYDLEGLSGPEIAARMGRSRGAIHMIRTRALSRLRELLAEESWISGGPA